MSKRFVSIWFSHLKTDWFARHKPGLKKIPFVLAINDRGRKIIVSTNELAELQAIEKGMAVADARAILPGIEVLDDIPDLIDKLLKGFAEWFIRYTPVVAIDSPDGLILDATGCAHLWGGEKKYIDDIRCRLKEFGYSSNISIADTIGTAWAVSRFANNVTIIESGNQAKALLELPASALRLELETIELLNRLGLCEVGSFISMQRSALRRRFGQFILLRLDQALGNKVEILKPIELIAPYKEWLPAPEPILTATGIEIGLKKLLERLCECLGKENKGLRIAIFKCYRIDGKILSLHVSTNHPSSSIKHLFKLFEVKIDTLEPDLGIELFTLEALKVEDAPAKQEKLWGDKNQLLNMELAELLDRIACKVGNENIHRFLPDEHYWPERSYKPAMDLNENLAIQWKIDRPRPIKILPIPSPIEVTAPIPDYPPMLFRFKGKLHKIVKADGPERIEQEWWIQDGQHRDYYSVEDESGNRYWLFRLGHYDAERSYQWFIHGFFA